MYFLYALIACCAVIFGVLQRDVGLFHLVGVLCTTSSSFADSVCRFVNEARCFELPSAAIVVFTSAVR